MFLNRTKPPNRRQEQRQRQQAYQKDLDAQVSNKNQTRLEEMARKHAEKYTQQFGLVNQIAAAPDSGFSVSPRYNQQPSRPEYPNTFGANNNGNGGTNAFIGGGLARTRVGLGNNNNNNNNIDMRGGQSLNDQLAMDLESRFGQISKAFLAADVDRSGSLEVGELRRLCRMYNLPTNKVESAFALSDLDHNGKIQYSEFVSKLVRKDYPGNTRAPMPGMGRTGGSGYVPSTNYQAPVNNQQPSDQQHLKNSTRYRNSLGAMWQGPGTSNTEVQTKRALQNQYQQELAKQVYERKQRDIKAKNLELEDERRAKQEALAYNPWGKGGAGAPLMDERGRMITDLRDVHEVAALGGVSPKADRNGGVTGGGGYDRIATGYGSPNGMRGGVIGGGNQRTGLNNRGGGGYNNNNNNDNTSLRATITGNQYTAAENTARQIKTDALKSALSIQIEEKRRRQALDKQRRVEMERREEERVKREQNEIRVQYQVEHREQRKKEADLAEANRQTVELAKQKTAAAVAAMANGGGEAGATETREKGFSPNRNALRTPPGAGGYSPTLNGRSSEGGGGGGGGRSGGGRSGGGRNGGGRGSGGRESGGRGSMTVLRRELNDQHSSLLRKIEEQKNTIEVLRKNFEMYQQGGLMSARGNVGNGGNGGNGGASYGGGGGDYGGYGNMQQQQRGSGGGGGDQNGWAPGRQGMLAGTGKVVLQNIDLDNPDQLDNMLLDFVNKRGGYGPAKMNMPQF